MVRELAEELLEYCRGELRNDLRMVAAYTREDYHPIYTSESLCEALDEETRGAFRYPFIAVHRAIWLLSTNNDRIDDPDVVVQSYGTVQVIQFPITEREGIVISCTGEHHTITPLVAACREIVSGYR